MGNNIIGVEIAFLTTEVQVLITIQVSQDTTVQQAIEQSGILKRFPEINLNVYLVGIFHKRVCLNTPLKDRDRIEIYRDLAIDPKTKRRIQGSAYRNKNRD